MKETNDVTEELKDLKVLGKICNEANVLAANVARKLIKLSLEGNTDERDSIPQTGKC